MRTTEKILENVKQSPHQFVYFDNPSDETILQAISYNWHVFKYLKNPSESLCDSALKTDGRILSYFRNPSKKEVSIASETILKNSCKRCEENCYFKRFGCDLKRQGSVMMQVIRKQRIDELLK